MIPVRFGDHNLPLDLDYASRFDSVQGAVVSSSPNDMPPVAQPQLVLGDVLSTSPVGKHHDDTVEYRRLFVPGLNEAWGEALSGRRNNADATRLTGVKLAAAGYLNPFDVVAGAVRPDIPLMAVDLEMVP